MKQSALIYGFFGLLIGLVIGFWLANIYSRGYTAASSAQHSISLQSSPQSNNAGEKLSRDEIAASFAAAENRKDDLDFQKKLGLALARYAAAQNDFGFLTQLSALLERAGRLSGEKDADILVALADVYFLQARESSDQALYAKARNLYQQAIRLNQNNLNVKTGYASVLLFSQPAQPDAAIAQLNSILKQHPQHEDALQLLILALIQSGKLELAEQKLSELKKINPAHPAISDLEAQLTQNKIKLSS